MTEAALNYYLHKVLGMRGISVGVNPHPATASAVSASVKEEFSVSVLTPFPLSSEEREFVHKMLSVLGQTQALFMNQNESTNEDVSRAMQEKNSQILLTFGVMFSPPSFIEVVELAAITDYLTSENPQKLQNLKRQAWEKLKKIKSRLKN